MFEKCPISGEMSEKCAKNVEFFKDLRHFLKEMQAKQLFSASYALVMQAKAVPIQSGPLALKRERMQGFPYQKGCQRNVRKMTNVAKMSARKCSKNVNFFHLSAKQRARNVRKIKMSARKCSKNVRKIRKCSKNVQKMLNFFMFSTTFLKIN
jgi:hypothetical protein